jgi:hypothetical protein
VFNLPDNTPPSVTGTSPVNGAIGVPLEANATAAFSEVMDPATLTTTTFRLREVGAGSDVPASVSYAGLTATLDPTNSLAPGKTYRATVSASVADMGGNALGADYTWTFATANITTLADTTSADFNAASPKTCAVVAHTGDGEVTLVPLLGEEFDGEGLPSGWVSYIWNTGGTASVSGGKLTVNGARANPDPTTNNYGPGRSIEFSATYATTTQYQQGGFGGGNNAPPPASSEIYNTAPMTTFTTEASGANLYARAWVLAGSNNVSPTLGTSWQGSAQRYRIVWNASNVQYYINGNLAYTWNVAVTGSMRPAFSEYFASGGALSVDWMRMSPYGSSCAFESRVFDAGHLVDWLTLTAAGSQPTGTAYTFETRSGSSTSPGDGSWSAWQPVSGTTIASPNARYLQYRATLTTTDDRVTSELQRVDLSFDSCSSEICNGLDDDCDGSIDEDLGSTTCGIGMCQRTVPNCSGGVPQTCVPGLPTTESCNGLDDDCNGIVDDSVPIGISTGLVGIPDQIVTAPILLGNVAGRGAYSAELDVTFDTSVLTALSVADGGC